MMVRFRSSILASTSASMLLLLLICYWSFIVPTLVIVSATDDESASASTTSTTTTATATCTVDPSYCNDIVQQKQNELEETFHRHINSLQDEMTGKNDAINKCQVQYDESRSIIGQLNNELEEKKRQFDTTVSTLQQDTVTLKNTIGQLEKLLESARNDSTNQVRVLQSSLDETTAKSIMYEKRLKEVLVDKQKIRDEHDKLKLLHESIKKELFDIRHELYYAKEELRKPAERRKMYKLFIKDVWDATKIKYDETKEWLQPHIDAGHEYYINEIEPRRIELVSYISTRWYTEVYPIIQPHYDVAKTVISKYAIEGYNVTRTVAIKFWIDTTEHRMIIRTKLMELVAIAIPYLITAFEHITDIVHVTFDYVSDLCQTHDAPYFVIDFISFLQERSQEVAIVTMTLTLFFIIIPTTLFIIRCIFTLLFRSGKTKESTKEKGKNGTLENQQQQQKTPLVQQDGKKKLTSTEGGNEADGTLGHQLKPLLHNNNGKKKPTSTKDSEAHGTLENQLKPHLHNGHKKQHTTNGSKKHY